MVIVLSLAEQFTPRRTPMQRVIAVAALLLVLASASDAQTFEKKNFNYSNSPRAPSRKW
jgi:hypothetical protein